MEKSKEFLTVFFIVSGFCQEVDNADSGKISFVSNMGAIDAVIDLAEDWTNQILAKGKLPEDENELFELITEFCDYENRYFDI